MSKSFSKKFDIFSFLVSHRSPIWASTTANSRISSALAIWRHAPAAVSVMFSEWIEWCTLWARSTVLRWLGSTVTPQSSPAAQEGHRLRTDATVPYISWLRCVATPRIWCLYFESDKTVQQWYKQWFLLRWLLVCSPKAQFVRVYSGVAWTSSSGNFFKPLRKKPTAHLFILYMSLKKIIIQYIRHF